MPYELRSKETVLVQYVYLMPITMHCSFCLLFLIFIL